MPKTFTDWLKRRRKLKELREEQVFLVHVLTACHNERKRVRHFEPAARWEAIAAIRAEESYALDRHLAITKELAR